MSIGESTRPRTVLAAFALFLGLSAANAVGGGVQAIFYAICVLVLLLRPHRIPLALLGGSAVCTIISGLSSLQDGGSIATLSRFTRPVVEGYLIATFLRKACNIRSLDALAAALAGYVMLQMVTAGAMAWSPELRANLLDSWYPDESYGSSAFEAALLFRGFGVSRHHLFGLALALGTIFVLLAGYDLKNTGLPRRALVLGSIFSCLILILYNARIGIIPIVCLYALGISIFFRPSYIWQMLVLCGLVLPILPWVANTYQSDVSDLRIAWLISGALQFDITVQSAGSTTTSDLLSMIHLPPDTLAWIIGNGRICKPVEICHSDIGWIRLLQEGGIMLTIAVAMLYLSAIRQVSSGLRHLGLFRRTSDRHASDGLLAWAMVLTFMLATIKGEAYAANEYSRLLMTLAVLVYQLPCRQRCVHARLSPATTS